MAAADNRIGSAVLIAFALFLLFAVVRLGPQIRFGWGLDQYDVRWCVYVGDQVDRGMDPYNPQDRPQLRDSEFEWNNSWLPPLNLVALGGVRTLAGAVQPGAEPVAAVSRAFAVFDAAVGALLFLLLALVSRMSLARAALIASAWYGLNPLAISSNVFTPEDKPIYALMILALFYVLFRLQSSAENDRAKTTAILFVAACAGIGLTGGYRVVTLSLIPVILVWGFFVLTEHRWRTLAVGLAALGVTFALTILPYFPNSLAVFGVRTGSLSRVPTAASVWQWLPAFDVQLAGRTVALSTLVAIAAFGAIILLLWFRKAPLTLAAGLALMVVTVILSVDNSLDRAMLAWTPLVLVLAVQRPKLMTFAGIAAACIAAPIAYHSMHVVYNEPMEALFSIGMFAFLVAVSALVIVRPPAIAPVES